VLQSKCPDCKGKLVPLLVPPWCLLLERMSHVT
jgi:hypothetical protein